MFAGVPGCGAHGRMLQLLKVTTLLEGLAALISYSGVLTLKASRLNCKVKISSCAPATLSVSLSCA
jgi:hypothetical protein